eukprot:scaffold6706_cov119-Isochrysis_galbana.AAC.3
MAPTARIDAWTMTRETEICRGAGAQACHFFLPAARLPRCRGVGVGAADVAHTRRIFHLKRFSRNGNLTCSRPWKIRRWSC